MRRTITSGGGMAVGLLVALIGVAGGVGAYTFIYANGASYLTDDATACVNCHIMRDQYESWLRGSHHSVATCNDCHTPHDFTRKYATKARNGFNHSLAFTTGRFHEPIQITPRNRAITEDACRRCHQAIVESIDHGTSGTERLACVRCHESVGHLH